MRSAGLLMYRRTPALEVLLVHPGGPYFLKRDRGWWGLPKGLVEPGESELEAARREFVEETSFHVPGDAFLALGEIRQKAGKVVVAWAFESDVDPERLASNTFELEWPPNSGKHQSFPEVDRAAWFGLEDALSWILPAQGPLLERLSQLIGAN
jgi:predicted NUDIX family NTP pyrophosphohydrolase